MRTTSTILNQGCIFFCLTPHRPGGGGQKYDQITGWGKKLLKGDKKKEGKCIFFYQLVKSMHIFYPIDLKYTKLKKRLNIFPLRRAPLVIKISVGENT